MSLIKCEQLSKSYGSKQALNKVTIELKAGSPIALVGPNGAGKTTLFSLLCGYLLPSSGSVTIMGEKPGSANLLGKVSSLPQDATLDPNLNLISQFILFGTLQGLSAKAAKDEGMRVLTLVGLSDVSEQKPQSLSHGMSKRASIAQALIGSPQLVLLDEPTAGLDPANAKVVRDLVKSLSGIITFVISSHNLDELEKLCDQVIYLDQGKLGRSVSIQENLIDEYITVSMQTCDITQFIDEISALNGVNSVTQKQENEFLIHYSADDVINLEIQLFQLFSHNDWRYRAILKGRSLEDKLFS
ncbi:ABC transporter ATP-binding protein [Shewanella sp. D64]|uniref:ABC transporter ATP-binding protein n=1 Tax=unclassified Shewanella TaxID=196818 RepID=UPI0022BA2F77|nr:MULTISPECIES: ABC transporter ATP-binding protein [unclassified Shewanella]MEC4724887.1 ABC transporter ATP-binding protein [Shewanella sp. D64]MEC4736320.1 ABC transporter ATP-binding protein [Shewanella sp. E94]WBJ97619.1 ABC transporter ATP-binding protein [Shewanella sp. MTB7]